MIEMQPVNFRSFKQKVRYKKKGMRRFLNRLEKAAPRGLENLTAKLEQEVWQEVGCLSCANCCKTMTPTFTPRDVKRISAHFNQTPEEFRKKWLYKERG